MIILNATTKSLEIVLAGAVASTQLPFTASFVDVTTTTYTPGENDGTTNSATAVTVVAAPAASTQRQIKLIDVHNSDSASATVTIRYNNNGTTRILFKAVIASGSHIVYTDGEGWRVFDSNGSLLQASSTVSGSRWAFPLGGSREYGIIASAATAVPSYVDVVLNGSLYSGWTIQARVDVRTTDSGTSVTPRVQNITDATTAGTGSSSTGTAEDYSGVNQSQTITLTLAAGAKTYRLQITPGNASADVYGIGLIELLAP